MVMGHSLRTEVTATRTTEKHDSDSWENDPCWESMWTSGVGIRPKKQHAVQLALPTCIKPRPYDLR